MKDNMFEVYWSILIIMMIMMIISIIACAVIPSTASAEDFLPANFAFSDDYYTIDGAPNIFASVEGDTEMNRGETGVVRIDLANKGVITYAKPSQSAGDKISTQTKALQELQKEISVRTKALGLNAVLISDNPQIDIVPAPQTLKSLESGSVTQKPLEFTVTVNENAAAGVYLLNLTVQYQYVDEVRMFSKNIVRLGVTNMTYDMHYATAIQSISVPITVKPAADFKVIDIDGGVEAKGSGFINITYKNTGELPVYDAVARMVVFSPLSLDKSQHYLGTIESGDTVTASFYVSANRDALAKAYSADSEIKYLDHDNKTIISDNMKININVFQNDGKGGITGMQVLLILLIVAVLSYVADVVRNRKNKSKSNSKSDD